MDQLKMRLAHCAMLVWSIWTIYSIVLFVRHNAELAIIVLYILYMTFGAALLGQTRRDLLSPPGLFTLAGFTAFGLTIPIIFAGNRYIATTDQTSLLISDDSLLKALVVLVIAQAGFVIGYFSRVSRYMPVQWAIRTVAETRKVSLGTYLLLVVVLVAAGYTRIKLHLGEAGIQPTIAYAGYIQYILFDGAFLLCIWFFAQGLRQGRLYIVLGLSLLLMLAVTQALLGWRGGVVQIGYTTIGLLWYQSYDGQRQRPYSLAWLILLLLAAGAIMQLGNAVRSERLGGDREFASSIGGAVEKILYRAQGTTRLVNVVTYVGPLTLFNNFLIMDLYDQGLTTTMFIDRKLYAVDVDQSFGFGTSGPGGPYVAMGLFGVFASYFLLGAFFRSIYVRLFKGDGKSNNILAVVVYSYLIFTLSALLSENFGISFLKNMIAIFCELLVLKILIQRTNGAGPDPSATNSGGAVMPADINANYPNLLM